MPQWWKDFMLWMDESTIPLYVVLIVLALAIAVQLVRAWFELRVFLKHDPPPYD